MTKKQENDLPPAQPAKDGTVLTWGPFAVGGEPLKAEHVTKPLKCRVAMPFKRFIAFVGDVYYPVGGMHDVDSTHDTLEEALKAVPPPSAYDTWGHVLDTQTGLIYEPQENTDAKSTD